MRGASFTSLFVLRTILDTSLTTGFVVSLLVFVFYRILLGFDIILVLVVVLRESRVTASLPGKQDCHSG